MNFVEEIYKISLPEKEEFAFGFSIKKKCNVYLFPQISLKVMAEIQIKGYL
jgi:hypothetical protein